MPSEWRYSWPLRRPSARSSAEGSGAWTFDQVAGALVQGPRGLTLRVALDAAVGRIGRIPGHPADLEREGVHPGAVAVPVGQVDGAVGHDAIERLRGRGAAFERVHRPSAAQDPRHLGVGVGVGLDRGEVFIGRRQVVQVALEHVQAAAHGMDVRVLEPRHQHASGQIDDLRARSDSLPDVVVRADDRRSAVRDRDGLRPAARGIDRVHGAVHQHGVCRCGRTHRTRPPDLRGRKAYPLRGMLHHGPMPRV